MFRLPAYIVVWANSGLRVDLAGICLLACVSLQQLQCLKKSCVLGSVWSSTLPQGRNVLVAVQMQKQGPILKELNVHKRTQQPTGGCRLVFSTSIQPSQACPTEDLSHWNQMRVFSSSNELENCKGHFSLRGGTFFLKKKESRTVPPEDMKSFSPA